MHTQDCFSLCLGLKFLFSDATVFGVRTTIIYAQKLAGGKWCCENGLA